jgi:hypothetical protein
MAKVLEMPVSFERQVVSVDEKPGDDGCEVEFKCGHSVWFAVPVMVGEMYHCSPCFEIWRNGKRRAGA